MFNRKVKLKILNLLMSIGSDIVRKRRSRRIAIYRVSRHTPFAIRLGTVTGWKKSTMLNPFPPKKWKKKKNVETE